MPQHPFAERRSTPIGSVTPGGYTRVAKDRYVKVAAKDRTPAAASQRRPAQTAASAHLSLSHLANRVKVHEAISKKLFRDAMDAHNRTKDMHPDAARKVSGPLFDKAYSHLESHLQPAGKQYEAAGGNTLVGRLKRGVSAVGRGIGAVAEGLAGPAQAYTNVHLFDHFVTHAPQALANLPKLFGYAE